MNVMKRLACWFLVGVILVLIGNVVLAQGEPITKIIVESKKVSPGTRTTIQIAIRDLPEGGFSELRAVRNGLTFDPRVLLVLDVRENPPFQVTQYTIDNSIGAVFFIIEDGGTAGIAGDILLILDVVALGDSQRRYSDLKLSIDSFLNRSGQPIPYEIRNGRFGLGGENRPPVADAGQDKLVATGTPVRLDASRSNDPDGDPLLFSWRFVSRPPGSGATLTDAGTASPSFVPDLPGTYVLEVTVDDGFGGLAADRVTVLATDDPHVLTIFNLIDLIRSFDLTEECLSVRDTLIGLLESVQGALLEGRLEDGVQGLEQFIAQVESQVGTCLTQDQADQVLAIAKDLLSSLLNELVLKGDVDGDGRITILDARLALEHALGLIELTRLQRLAADVDGDGQVTQADADQIAQMVVQPPVGAVAVRSPRFKTAIELVTRASALGYTFTLQSLSPSNPAASVKLEVYTLQGRKIFQTAWQKSRQLRWNLRTTSGQRAANGVYLYVVSVKDAQGRVVSRIVKKLVVLR
jgi:hypothetical protein